MAEAALEQYNQAVEYITKSEPVVLQTIPTPTHSPCHPSEVEDDVERLVRFDARWTLAFNAESVSEMEGIREELEDVTVPACLEDFKALEEAHFSHGAKAMAFLQAGELDAADRVIDDWEGIEDAYLDEMGYWVDWVEYP